MNADSSSDEARVLAALRRISTDDSYGEPLAAGNAKGSVYMRCFREVNADGGPKIDTIRMVAAMINLWNQGKIAEGPVRFTFWVTSDQPSLVAV